MENANQLPIGFLLHNGASNTYRIERVLGSGGFGITYLASVSVKFGNVSVKVKVAIKEHFMSSDCERDPVTSRVMYSNPVRERVENSLKDFIAEAQRLQAVGVEHPNIVKVNEVFEANNTAYYVMEYLDGISLRSYVRDKGRLSEAEMKTVITPIMDAVDYLHKKRMTHLDIKPDNIMLCHNEDGTLRPVLIDFGLSKHYDRNGKPTSTINTLGCSDGYAPVEQYAGITTFSPASDYYALGATIWFCLTGHDPHRSTDTNPDKLSEALPEGVSNETRTMLREGPLQMDKSKRFMPFFETECQEPVFESDVNSETKNKVSRPTTIIKRSKEKGNRHWWKTMFVVTLGVIIGVLIFLLATGGDDSLVESNKDHVESTEQNSSSVESNSSSEIPPSLSARTEYQNLDLCAIRNNTAYFFTLNEWTALSAKEQANYTKVGILIEDGDFPFVFSLDCVGPMTWKEAYEQYGEYLPDEDQSATIARQAKDIIQALKAYGAKDYDSAEYWSGYEYNEWYAYFISMTDGTDEYVNLKRRKKMVRFVALLSDIQNKKVIFPSAL